jgi:hypothetical protein
MDVILKAYIQRNKRKKGNNLKANRESEREREREREKGSLCIQC